MHQSSGTTMSNTTTSNAAGRSVLLVVCISMFFAVLNASAVGVVLPEIAGGLAIDPGQLVWLMTGFLLVFGVAIPFYGRLADLHGAQPMFLLGVGIFSVGSLLAASATNFEFLLVARIVQAAGGAAVPGLGMALASKAYGPEARGTVLGMVAATIGVGGAIGPLLGGALSELLGWRSIFFLTASVGLVIPVAIRVLPRDEDRTEGNLDLIGGAALGLMVAGILMFPAEGSRSGWTSTFAMSGVGAAVIGLVVLSARQLTAESPLIPRELLRNARYIAQVSMSFSVIAANLAPLIGLPVLLALTHQLSSLEIGLVMLPGAVLGAAAGLLSGRLTDRVGPQIPTWIGSPLMLVSVIGLSSSAGSSPWVIAGYSGLLGAGFGFVNTPLAATISRTVSGNILASALSINSMLFFLGGSLGTAVFMAIGASNFGDGRESLNPLHSGAAGAFSDGFLLLAVPVIAAMALSFALPRLSGRTVTENPTATPATATNWVPVCSVPWSPECVEALPPRTECLALAGASRSS